MIDPDAKIALTGVGAITPLGDADETWSRLMAGESGLEAAPEALRRAGCQVVGRAGWFDAGDFMDRNVARRMGRFSQFSVAAAGMAMADAGLEGYTGDGLGVVVHTGAGGLLEAETAAGPTTSQPARRMTSGAASRPDRPASSRSHVQEASPRGVTAPMPVTAMVASASLTAATTISAALDAQV